MKRSIKFKCWDTKNNRFVDINGRKIGALLYDNTIAISTGWDGDDNPTWDWSKVDLDKYEFLQFTGLLDKNGNEIYEGDIIMGKFRYDEDEPGYRRDVIAATIDYINGWWRANGIRMGKWTFPLTGILNIEVVGNIYENPELLK